MGLMNRILVALNIAAAGSIAATNSSSLLTAISPYGGGRPARPAVAPPVVARSVVARSVAGPALRMTTFVCPPPLPAAVTLALLP